MKREVFAVSADFYAYAAELKKYLEAQAARIAALESEVRMLKAAAMERSEQPPMNVEKIEYKFDQLKIERLEGTLNIGVNPANLKELDELFVNGTPYSAPFSQPVREELKNNISTQIGAFINAELPSIISNAEREAGKTFNSQFDGFIKDDLLRQLPERVDYYLQKYPFNDQLERKDEFTERLVEQIKTDVEQAVRSFVLNAHDPQQTPDNQQNGGM